MEVFPILRNQRSKIFWAVSGGYVWFVFIHRQRIQRNQCNIHYVRLWKIFTIWNTCIDRQIRVSLEWNEPICFWGKGARFDDEIDESSETRPDTRLPQSRAVGQGPYLRSLDHLGRSHVAKDRKNPKKVKFDGWTDRRTNGTTMQSVGSKRQN